MATSVRTKNGVLERHALSQSSLTYQLCAVLHHKGAMAGSQ